MVVDFDPQKLYGFTFTASSEKLIDYVDELRRLADSHDAGLFLQFSSSEKEQEEQENSKKSSLSDAPESTMTYIFSSNPSLFPDYTFSDKKVDWSASGKQAYVLPYQEGVGRINQITNELPGHLHGKDLGFYPLSMLAEANSHQEEILVFVHFFSDHLEDLYSFLSKESKLTYVLIPLDHYQKGVKRPLDDYD